MPGLQLGQGQDCCSSTPGSQGHSQAQQCHRLAAAAATSDNHHNTIHYNDYANNTTKVTNIGHGVKTIRFSVNILISAFSQFKFHFHF